MTDGGKKLVRIGSLKSTGKCVLCWQEDVIQGDKNPFFCIDRSTEKCDCGETFGPRGGMVEYLLTYNLAIESSDKAYLDD